MDGELEQVEDRWRLRFVRRLPHSPEKVWRALPIYAAVVKRTKHPFGSTRPNPPEPRIAT